MNAPMNVEVKYRKFPIQIGQRLRDIPEYLSWKEEGWTVKWACLKSEGDTRVVETLLHRMPDGAMQN
jgi:hypothetical protein